MTTSETHHTLPGRPTEMPHGPSWWTQSISDGGAHYGARLSTGLVVAVCGCEFEPESNPYTREPVALMWPADREHACRRCVGLAPVEARP